MRIPELIIQQCPFCGGEQFAIAKLSTYPEADEEPKELPEAEYQYAVVCLKCESQGKPSPDMTTCIKHWNRRTK